MIPVNAPRLGARELEYVTECLQTGWISSQGRFIEAFEKAWATYCGVAHGVAVSNGTAALEIAVKCLQFPPGSEIILPTFTFISCALAVLYAGHVPVLVDANPRTWGIDVTQIEAKITSRTRAIMPVHIYGHPVDVDPIRELARQYELVIIEDAAEAHGALYKGQRCGGLGDLGCFSFFANKLISTGEGGMVVTPKAEYAERLRALRNLGSHPERRFLHTELGHNFRLTNLQAALGLAQLEGIESALAHKRWLGAAYAKRLSVLPGLQLLGEEAWATPVCWMFCLVLDDKLGLDATELARRLAARGVMTRPFFLGMHQQPALRARGLFQGERYPVAERLARQGLYLPSGLTLTASQQEQVCDAVEAELQPLATRYL